MFQFSEMCTGNFVREDLAPKGTKCVSPCIFRGGYWGTSFCWTNMTDMINNDGYGWGAECVPCSGMLRYTALNDFPE